MTETHEGIGNRDVVQSTNRNLWSYALIDASLLEPILSVTDIPRPIAETLYKRGISDPQILTKYLQPSLSNLLNPFLMTDMELAVDRIYEAIVSHESICIYGDYDVDGIASTSLMLIFLRHVGAKYRSYIPSRLHEGNGLNKNAIDILHNKGVSLLITVDCGIGNLEEIKYAHSLGMTVIVTDHHNTFLGLPPEAYAVINPKRDDDLYPFKDLSASGIVFKIIMALKSVLVEKGFFDKHNIEKPHLADMLGIAALGTMADLVPLVGENRIIVKEGLKMLCKEGHYPGLDALFEHSSSTKPQNLSVYKVGFLIAPRINAAGRLGSCQIAVDLLMCQDNKEANAIATKLENTNHERRQIERIAFKQCVDIIEEGELHNKHECLILHSDDWHLGVVGIVASRLVDKYHMPVIIMTSSGDYAKGSVRTVSHMDILAVMQQCGHMLLDYGGHPHAAGIQILVDNIPRLQAEMDRIIMEMAENTVKKETLHVGSCIAPHELDNNLVEWIDHLAPFGYGNKEPLFCMDKVQFTPIIRTFGTSGSHCLINIECQGYTFECVVFNCLSWDLNTLGGKEHTILFTLSLRENYLSSKIQLKILDIAEGSMGKL